ncbi:hypothetical protein GCM10027282_15770 [Frigoribacterium salinisoli]
MTTTAVLAAALLLTGCQGGAAQPSPEPTVTETATVTPPPTPSATPDEGADGDGDGGDDGATATPTTTPTTVSIPTGCTDLVSADRYEATFGDTPLNPEGFGGGFGQRTPTAPPAGADGWAVTQSVAELRCLWRDPRADITGIGIDLGRVTPEQGDAVLAYAAGRGFDCGELHGGTSCQLVTRDQQYPVDRGQTFFVRDGVLVHVDQSNFPTDDLLGAIVTRIWG